MRRKSERTASKKSKASPEKKIEKVKRTKTKRRKQSSSSGNDSSEDTTKGLASGAINETVSADKAPKKEDSPEESQEQVWQVKTAETSGDGGEIQKLKICLTRPPSTPERADRSPRSKRKHSRATSSSDTPSVEGSEEKKKTKHRSKKLTCEPNETSEKNNDIQGDEQESDIPTDQTSIEIDALKNKATEILQPNDEVPMSIDTEEVQPITVDSHNDEQVNVKELDTKSANIGSELQVKAVDRIETENKDVDGIETENKDVDEIENENKDVDTIETSPKTLSPVSESTKQDCPSPAEKDVPERKRSTSIDKSEILEIHAEESRFETSDIGIAESQNEENTDKVVSHEEKSPIENISAEVSISEDKSIKEFSEKADPEQEVVNNKTDVASIEKVVKEKSRKDSSGSNKDISKDFPGSSVKHPEHSGVTHSSNKDTVHNGQATPIVINRKRRWGTRLNKITSQKSLTISTDVLKEIIPDVKPVEFDEVIEEKKHQKRQVTEKIERPILPKIVIDNTENLEQTKRDQDKKDKENLDNKDTAANVALSRKISILKETEGITIIRPPSPPRHKQSNILYITNLVRPFTLPQLKNLLQRTGKIVENGFWIDRIKSKCFVIYENEDQAVETRHALHGVTWPVSNPKTLHVDFSIQDEFDKAKANEETDNAKTSTIPGTVEDWLREQDLKRERGELEKPWERKPVMREWDVGKNEKVKEKEKDKLRREDRSLEKRRHRTPERSPEPAKKFKKKEEAPAKLLDDLFRKTKSTPCIYWLPLSAETIAIKEEQRRQHMAEHERRLQELRRTHRRH